MGLVKDAIEALERSLSATGGTINADTHIVMRTDDDAPSFPEWVFGEKDRFDMWGLVYIL